MVQSTGVRLFPLNAVFWKALVTPAPRIVSRLAVVPLLRWVLWALLALMVLMVVVGLPDWAVEMFADGRIPRVVLILPATFFGLFVIVFAVYRLLLVRAGRYNAGKAFVQVGLAALVLMLLLPTSLARYRAVEPQRRVPVSPLLVSDDPAVRAVACEALAARRGDDPAREIAERLASEDPDPLVRAACRKVR